MREKGFLFLDSLLSAKSFSHTSLSEKLGISPQAIQGWKRSNEIPTKRVSQIADLFALERSEIDLLLGKEPLKFEFRTKNGEELSQDRVSESVRVHAEIVFERFFGDQLAIVPYDLTELRQQIATIGNNFFQIAQVIRKTFTIPDYHPMGYSGVNELLKRVGVQSYFLPFSVIGLCDPKDNNAQTAVLYSKENKHVILIDSDRRVDEAHFDQLHELIHIFLGDIDLELPDNELETLIDRICGELIYPQRYIVDVFFDGDPASKPITDRENLKYTFTQESSFYYNVLSPKGLARAMRDSDLTTVSSELYKYLNSDLHLEFKELATNYTTIGKMNFDFKNPKELVSFYRYIEEKNSWGVRYPLFVKLKEDLLSGRLSNADFADTFSMTLQSALIVKATWAEELRGRA